MSTGTDLQHESESTGVEVKTSFRVMGANLEPTEVSRLLEMEPAKAHARGDANLGESGRQYSDFPEGLWTWRPSVSAEAPLTEQLSVLVNVLEPKAAVLQSLREAGLSLDVFVGVLGPGGNFVFALEHVLLKRLGNLGVALVFDLYSY